MCVPITISLLTDGADLKAFSIGAAITLVAGLSATFLVRNTRTEMAKREGFLLTSLVWIVFSAFGMIPFILSDTQPLRVTDAFFEAMAGFTTTGSTIVSSPWVTSQAAVIWRSVMQWLGGMGIILFTLAVLPMLNSSGGMQMFNAEVTGITHDKIRPRISQTAMGLWGIYITLTAALFIMLIIGPMPPFQAFCHALTTISTGGYSSVDGSVGYWDNYYTDLVLIVFMFLGGANFSLIYKASIGQSKSIWRNDVFRAYVYLILGAYLLFVIAILACGNYTGIASVTIDPLFQVISLITSTGFVARGSDMWGPFVLSLSFILIFFGGCAGSTSGGAKLDRLLMMLKHSRNELHKTLHPNAVMTVRANGRTVPSHIVAKVIAFLCIFVMVTILGGMILAACGVPVVDAFFSSFSCITNVGLPSSYTGYGGDFATIPDLGKWTLALLMLIGRLELFTVLILFTPGFWRK
ncbi:MAG: TrkH family potassium uptake protein [Bacteroides sp.]|nr:TrkH family potassium uptake protein [Bacteroides sp.]